ncbi:MAG: hypothetical protein OEZ40_07095 [Candidatus Bathyarchaeota archaeon]|nr:hypothetical protein [Candidatus Bathyarchaeota archaeon]
MTVLDLTTHLVLNSKIYYVLRQIKSRVGFKVGGPSEADYKEKLNKTRENMYKKINDVRKEFAEIEKIKVDALKKIDESRRSAENDLHKIEEDIVKSKDLAPESKRRLRSEIDTLKREVEDKHVELRTRISETMIPT